MSLSVFERAYPKGRSGAENGRGRRNPAWIDLRLFRARAVPDIFFRARKGILACPDWSYETLEREVRASLLYRTLTRIGGEKAPDAKTMVRQGQALGPEVIRRIDERVVQRAREQQVVQGRKMRLDTTVVESNIRYPTDSGLLGDGIRVLTRTMKRVKKEVGDAGTRVRNWMCRTTHRLLEVGGPFAVKARK